MRAAYAFVLVGLLAIEGIVGRPSHDSLSNTDQQHLMGLDLINPLLMKTQNSNENILDILNEYKDTMAKLRLKLTTSGDDSLKANLDSCQELKASMDKVHEVADNATIFTFQILNEMSDILSTASDCITINIFKAVNCSAHKLKDGKTIYTKHKEEIAEIERELNDAIWEVAGELVKCFKKVNS